MHTKEKKMKKINKVVLQNTCWNVKGVGAILTWDIMGKLSVGNIVKLNDIRKVYGIGKGKYTAIVHEYKRLIKDKK